VRARQKCLRYSFAIENSVQQLPHSLEYAFSHMKHFHSFITYQGLGFNFGENCDTFVPLRPPHASVISNPLPLSKFELPSLLFSKKFIIFLSLRPVLIKRVSCLLSHVSATFMKLVKCLALKTNF
jgi:hypothetical protein